jgi:hypothetical protein
MLLRLPQMEYNISIPMLIGLGILIFTGITSTILDDVVLVLLMRGIYDVCH